jgi:hypothetical protein
MLKKPSFFIKLFLKYPYFIIKRLGLKAWGRLAVSLGYPTSGKAGYPAEPYF